jgi:hypothetical protein
VSGKTPATVGCFSEKHPGAVGERRVACRIRDDRREPPHGRHLLVTVERSSVRQDLDTDVGAVAIGGRGPGHEGKAETQNLEGYVCREDWAGVVSTSPLIDRPPASHHRGTSADSQSHAREGRTWLLRYPHRSAWGRPRI